MTEETATANGSHPWKPGDPWTDAMRERFKASRAAGAAKRKGIPSAPTEAGHAPGRVTRPRPARSSGASQAEIRSAIETVNAMLIIGGMGKYALTAEEVTAETEALHLVVQDTPAIGHVLMRGKRFTVWGKFLWVNYVILARRRLVPDASGFFGQRAPSPPPGPAEQAAPGPAPAAAGDDRERQDDAAGADHEPAAVVDSSGHQA